MPGDSVKAALIQLPVQSHDYGYSIENVPLAAGYLASYAALHDPAIEIFICPGSIANLGGEAAILRWIDDVRPDIIGFSCYVWNIDRTLYLCSIIKERMERCLIVLGGPEITPDNEFLLSHDDFDAGVVGEGEETFLDLLQAAAEGRAGMAKVQGLMVRDAKGWVLTSPRSPVKDLESIPSPYLSGTLGLSLNKSMIMETVRGCPMRCTYCYYHKHLSHVRAFTGERISSEFLWANHAGVGEVTVIDPCFGRRPDLMPLLKSMASPGKGALPFSCELNAEDLDEVLVDALVKAGLIHVEIGLQSTNKKTLKNIGRFFDQAAFMKGIRMLKEAGVRVMTDIMVGLPGDSLRDVKKSIDFVLEERLCDDLSLYPLSVLPGTVLRTQADRFGISYQSKPPYLVLQTAEMDSDDIREAFAYAEDVTGIDYFPVELPRSGTYDKPRQSGIVSRIIIGKGLKDDPIRSEEIGQALCIEVLDPFSMRDREMIGERIQSLTAENPYTLVSWIIPQDGLKDLSNTIEFIKSFCPGIDHPADREYMATFDPMRSCQLFMRSFMEYGGDILTRIPLTRDGYRPLWAVMPPDAGPDQEQIHTRLISELLGFSPEIRYHDLPEEKPDDVDDLVGVRRFGFDHTA
jgi:hypothetical protein